MKISVDQELALRAALLPTPKSIQSWNDLVKSTPVLELDGSITRILPAIYQNLSGETSVEGFQKLKGSYLFAWAKNTEFITYIKPLLIALQASKIDYRILKGGALNFLFQSLGSRSMGDIDFLISKRDLVAFQEILETSGFRKKFADACPHIRSGDSDPELNYVNEKNIEIDLHVMEDRRPKFLFSLMLDTPAVICDFMEIQIKIPPAELLVMHSIYHGSIGVQSSDEIQSLLDVKRLLGFSTESTLIAVGSKLHFLPLLNQYLSLLYKITGESRLLELTTREHIWQRFRYTINATGDGLARLRQYPEIYRARKISSKDLRFVAKNFRGHRYFYSFWLATSKLRQIERLFFRITGGFLTLQPDKSGAPIFNNCSKESQDWRFAYPIEPGRKRVKIEFTSESFALQSFLVFMNGQVAGVTNRNPAGVHSLELLNPPKRVEISLRLPMNGCEKCAEKLKDLAIHLS